MAQSIDLLHYFRDYPSRKLLPDVNLSDAEKALTWQLQHQHNLSCNSSIPGFYPWTAWQPQLQPQQAFTVGSNYCGVSREASKEKRKRRMESNRQSARRSKQRRQEQECQLASQTKDKLKETKMLRTQLDLMIPHLTELQQENCELREELNKSPSSENIYVPNMPPPTVIPDNISNLIIKLTKSEEDLIKEVLLSDQESREEDEFVREVIN